MSNGADPNAVAAADADAKPVDIVERAFEAIQAEFRDLLRDGGNEAKERLQILARDMKLYWELVNEGKAEEAAKNLAWMKAEANVIGARYAIKAGRVTNRTLLRVVDTLARVGAILLKGLL